MTQIVHVHLVSDSTGETVSSVCRAAIAQFKDIEAEEHIWSLVRTKGQIERVLEQVREFPGIVMYTISEKNLRQMLEEECLRMKVLCIPVLSRVIRDLSNYFNQESTAIPGVQHVMDDDYFSRVEAINFALAHDDGQSTWDLEEADVVIVGLSRTSKSPTCMYLAYRGLRAANIPFVPGCDLPVDVTVLKHPLIVGLTTSAERLSQVRKNRMLSLNKEPDNHYTDEEAIKQEIAEVKRLFNKLKCPVIDVTRRSVEETAATILQFYQEKRHTVKE